jgi:hypothetical protein
VAPERQWPPSSVVVNQAIGVTAEEFDCTTMVAYDALARHADATGQSLERVASDVVGHQNRCLR